tara:strand:- start:585 stop:1676 length:1092 start_codon:yes stop_codon:yes gene_type:complete
MIILSSLLSNNIIASLRSSLFYFRFGLFALSLWFLIDKNEQILKYIFYSITGCFLCLIIDGYIQYFFGKNLFGFETNSNNRVSSFFGSELILGSYISRFFPILFGLFVFIDQKSEIKNKILLILITVTFVLSEGLLVLSGERVALFFMNLSAVFIILMINDYKKYRFWTYVVSLLLIFALLFFFPQTKNRIINQTINDFTINPTNTNEKNDGKIYIFTKAHNDMYITGLKIFNENKFFGVGPRQYRNNCKEFSVSNLSCQSHPHNTYIELLSEAGVFAFFIVFGTFILIVYYSVVHFFKSIFKRKDYFFNDFEICIISAILISLWPLIPTGSFFNNWMSIVYYFPVGMFLWQRSKNQKISRKI